MDPRLLEYFNRELAHVREMGAEFAAEFPKVAARLGMEGIEVADPYVERLLEGFAFIAARIQLKIDAEFPRFTQQMLEIVFPHYLAPTPSFLVVECRPNLAEPALAEGVTLPAGTRIRSAVPRGEQTACLFRTAHALRLWPIEISAARYSSFSGDIPLAATSLAAATRASVRIELRTHAGLRFRQLGCDRLDFFVGGIADVSGPLYELIHSQCLGVLVVTRDAPPKLIRTLPATAIREVGFGDDEALIPVDRRTFQGYRLLREYFAFPQRFQFFGIEGLAAAFAGLDTAQCELVLLLGRNEPALEQQVDAHSFALHATPAVNLFERRADRIQLEEGRFEHHLVVDRGRPLDFEVHSIRAVRGISDQSSRETPFAPFYGDGARQGVDGPRAYYTMRREPRLLSARQRQAGTRTGYVGSEVFLSLVDEREVPYPASMRQLGVEVLATNRDLPLLLPIGSRNALTLDSAAPVESVRVLAGPTRPRPGLADGDFAWRLLSHLSLNYLSLLDTDPAVSADAGNERRSPVAGLRELLGLYADLADPALRKQTEAVTGVKATPITRRLPIAGPITFGRGLGIELTMNEAPFGGAGCFLMGSVLEKFLARHVSLNTFTQTRLLSESRGELVRWPTRIGTRNVA
ncbi:MAG: type VI secretion system baseplate subunit TssF [Burkholderiaceae bacterium]